MIIGIQGTKSFDDYSIFLRSMGTALSIMDSQGHEEFVIYTAGPVNINSMVQEFSNVSERSFKARGKKIRFVKVPPTWIKTNIHELDYFIFLSKPKEALSPLVREAEDHDVEVAIYRY